MAEPGQKRKLSAVLSADVVGYSRLMQDDDAATVETLTRYRAVFGDFVTRHEGRIVDSPGDNILAEFDSPVEAVQCAIELQREFARRNRQLAQHRQMQFRMGINLGDILGRDDGTIYGDAVNVAARLESLAEPGGIMISESVRMQVHSLIDVSIVDAGEHKVKNIAEPVHAYRIVLDQTAAIPQEARKVPRAMIAAATALVIAIVAGVMLRSGSESEDPILVMPTGPSIAVLPFNNMSGDPTQDFFADGIVEDILTRLSRFSDLRVIGRNSTFQYKNRAVDVRTVGRDLGAAYVLEGSVRRSADRIKVTVQLLNAADGSHVWANDYERDVAASGVFEIQAEIAASVAGKLGGGYGEIAQKSRRLESYVAPSNLTSYECILRLYEYWTIFTAEKHEEVRDCLEYTIKAEPTYAEAWAGLTWIYADETRFGYNILANSMRRSLDAGLKAVSLDPNSVMAHWTLAVTYFNRQELDPFFTYADRALELNPNDPITLAALGEKMVLAGYFDRGVPLMQKAASLNPNHPKWYFYSLSYASYQQRDYDTAAAYAEKADLPGFFWTWVYRTASYAQSGQKERAQAAARELINLYPDFANQWSEEFRKWNFPDHMAAHLAEGFEKAGLGIPDEPAVND